MPNYRGTSTFVVPKGIVLRKSTAAGVLGATRWEVYEGDKAPELGNWHDEDKRYLGDVVRWSYAQRAGWSWQPRDGEIQDFPSVGPISDILDEIAKEIRERKPLDYCHTHDGKCDPYYKEQDHDQAAIHR